MNRELRIDIWSDIACPWCYVGKRRLEAALERFAHADSVAIVWRAFELDAAAPPATEEAGAPYAERLARKYRTSVEEARTRIEQMTDLAAEDGLAFRFDRIRPGNTFDAHRLLHLAHARGAQDALKERLFRGYLSEGASMSDPDTLARLATEVGLDLDEVRATLASDAYGNEVRRDESEAVEVGVRGVPFFVVGGKYAVSGAQSADVLLQILDRAWQDVVERPSVVAAEGAACGPDGC